MFAVRHLQNRQENQVTLQFLFPDWCGFDFTISGTIEIEFRSCGLRTSCLLRHDFKKHGVNQLICP